VSIDVRLATLADLTYIDQLRRRESESIGFISRSGYEGVLSGYDEREGCRRNGRIWLATVNADPVGFAYATPGGTGRSVKVVQVCIQRDARRIEYGSALVAEVEAWAEQLQRPAVSCRVATDLDATAFWDALGFELHGHEQGGSRRGRVLERRHKPLPGLWLPIFTTPPTASTAAPARRDAHKVAGR
jgi:GNAT superfamily N-acetyltransferase